MVKIQGGGSELRRLPSSILALALTIAICSGFAIGFTKNAASNVVARIEKRLAPRDPRSNVIYQHVTLIHSTSPIATVTLLGDSLTQYGPWQRLFPRTVDFDNYGVSGDTSRGLLFRTADTQKIGPTAVVMIGVNDEFESINLEESSINIDGILQNLSGRRIILQSTLPVSDLEHTRRLAKLAEHEKTACAKVPRCTFVDVASGMTENGRLAPRFTTDGIHLSWLGYRQWIMTLSPYLNDTPPTAPGLEHASDDHTLSPTGRRRAV